ncbi:MAG: helix-turn-helix domain-containing protein [Bacteroidota bacterium]
MVKEPPPIILHFGQVIRELRRARRMSQEELANLSGLHRTYITDIERGSRNVSLKNISRLAQSFGIPITEVFTRLEQLNRNGEKVFDFPLNSDTAITDEILLVVNDNTVIERTQQALQQWNISYPIHVVRNGDEAEQFLFYHTSSTGKEVRLPKVILFDMNILPVNGFTLLERIRSEIQTKDIPVVVISASVDEVVRKRMKSLGIIHYIDIPIIAEQLTSMLRKFGFQFESIETSGSLRK